MGADRARRPDDRFIACATAEIALQRLFDARIIGIRLRHPQTVEAHHEARRAEAALRAVMIHHCLLHRVQMAVAPLQMLHRHHMTAMERPHEADAGIDAFIGKCAIRPDTPDQHRAGTAIALRAAFLGALQRPVKPQEIEQRFARTDGMKLDSRVIEKKAQAGTDRGCGHQLPR